MASKASFAYADDLKFVAGASSVGCHLAQAVINLVCQWSKSHHMPLSLDKCNVMHCGKDNPRMMYILGDQPVTCVAQFKDLGVLRIPDSTYSDHVRSVVAASSRLCGSMLHVFRTREPALLWAAYQAYIKPKLMYAAPVWSPFLKQHIQAVEQVQRRFCKRLAGLEAMPYESDSPC
jgi:ribonuclease P/MRP protein subunit RPP40